ncbi:hypothetical protein ACTQ3M_07170 [Oscillospiraceae bacterium LCP25S3_E10]
MNTEASLKKQAKSILAQNNWVKSIVGGLCSMSVLGAFLIIFNFASMYLSEDILKKPTELGINIAISVAALVVFILLSPVYTGYIRFIARCKGQETGDIKDIFYYFQRGKYADTVQLNLLLTLKKIALVILFFIPAAAAITCGEFFTDIKTILQICAMWLLILGALGYFLVSRFYALTQYLYVSDFHYRKERELTKASSYIVRKNFGKIISVYISFIPWMLLCFFAIPAVMVYPYFKHTTVLSYSYIYELANENPQSPYYHSNYPLGESTDEAPTEDTARFTNNAVSEIPPQGVQDDKTSQESLTQGAQDDKMPQESLTQGTQDDKTSQESLSQGNQDECLSQESQPQINQADCLSPENLSNNPEQPNTDAGDSNICS